MPFWKTYFHLVWATSNRQPLIRPEFEASLLAYLVKKAGEMGVFVYAVGGWQDHVHLIVAIPPSLAVAEVVKQIKGASSHYMNHTVNTGGAFAWQRGYGVLTLGERQRKDAEQYVRSQKTHHQSGTDHPWLERCTEEDDGPTDMGMKSGLIPDSVREAPVSYDVMGDAPF